MECTIFTNLCLGNSLKWNLWILNYPCMTIVVFQRVCLSSSMKFLVETDLSEIPAFYFTEHSYTLYLFVDVSYIVNWREWYSELVSTTSWHMGLKLGHWRLRICIVRRGQSKCRWGLGSSVQNFFFTIFGCWSGEIKMVWASRFLRNGCFQNMVWWWISDFFCIVIFICESLYILFL